MEAENAERELLQHAQQQRFQPRSGDVLEAGSHHLPLRDRVHCIDVINTLGSVQIALMYRVHTQIAGPSAGLGLTALADRDRSGPGFVKTIRCSR